MHRDLMWRQTCGTGGAAHARVSWRSTGAVQTYVQHSLYPGACLQPVQPTRVCSPCVLARCRADDSVSLAYQARLNFCRAIQGGESLQGTHYRTWHTGALGTGLV